MDIKAYIDSGILKQYVMEQLGETERVQVELLCDVHPEIKNALKLEEDRLVNFERENGEAPPVDMKDSIWNLLHNVNKEKEMDPNNLPLINRFTDHTKWLRFVEGRIPAQVNEDRVVTPLQQNDSVFQALVISKTDFENEEHVDELESFIILEGECECTIGDNVFRLGPGGFTDIPLHTPHWVRIVSPHVVAILQRVAV